jgi:CRISPR-associated endoribonuclease Cas6
MSQISPNHSVPLTWHNSTELVGLEFVVIPQKNATLFPQYTTTLHAWFLDQVRTINPTLSAQLHDADSKAFTISGLEGKIATNGGKLQIYSDQTYRWTLTAFSSIVVEWLAQWLQNLPPNIELRYAPLQIQSVSYSLKPTTYNKLFQTKKDKNLTLSFVTPTSFRRKGHHFPLTLCP